MKSPLRWVAAAGVTMFLLLVVSQLFLPGMAERRVEGKLDGQISDVDVGSFPAARLLFRDIDQVSFTVPSDLRAPEKLRKFGIETLELSASAEGDLVARPAGTGIALRLGGSEDGLEVDPSGLNPIAEMLLKRRLAGRMAFKVTSLEAEPTEGGVRLTVEGEREAEA